MIFCIEKKKPQGAADKQCGAGMTRKYNTMCFLFGKHFFFANKKMWHHMLDIKS